METRAVVPPQPRGNGKVHGEAPQRNQRAPLGDRTNYEAGKIENKEKLQARITRRITRSFQAQFLANAQKNNVNQVLGHGVIDKAAKNTKCAPAKKDIKKKFDEDVIVISSDEETEKPANDNVSKPVKGSRKDVRTFTSTLSARSKVNDYVCLSDRAYMGNQIRVMEKAILEKLGWYLTVPTSYVFLARYIKASISSDNEMKNMVFYLAELGLLDYQTTIQYSPSMIAAAAVYAAHSTLNKKPFWTQTLKHHTGYTEEQLRECAKVLVGFLSKAAESDLKAV